MPLLRFSAFTVLGSGIWNGLLIGLGAALGTRYELIDRYAGVLDWVVVGVLVVLLGWLVVRRIRRVRRSRAAR